MCVILVGKINRQLHEAAKKQNGDGFSCFTKETGLVKAPSESQVNRAINTFGIWHYRIASSGKVTKDNIHPFRVCNGQYLLYHNGVFGEGTVELSDTHCLAKTLEIAPLETVKSVLQAVSSGQRILLVNAKNPYEYYLYGDWKVDKGILMSHKMYYGATIANYNRMSYSEKAGWVTRDESCYPAGTFKKYEELDDEDFIDEDGIDWKKNFSNR